MQTLQGWTALVTGASAGIGEACALALSQAGARLVLAGRRGDRLEALAAKLPTPAHPLVLDVRSRRDVESALSALPAGFADVDILVNNAGLGLGLEPAHEASLDDWETMIDTNCKGLVYVTRAMLPGMVKRNRGHVVNLGSVAATYPYPGGNVYGATKAFVHQFSQNLKADLVGTRVRVTDIAARHGGDRLLARALQGRRPARQQGVRGHGAAHGRATSRTSCCGAVTRPARVNINVVEVMPADQGFGPFNVKRR